MNKTLNWIVGEGLGTFLLVFFGCGSVATAVTLGAQVGLFQVAIVWGMGLALAIKMTGPLSGAHLNPAITIAMATFTRFKWSRALGYIGIQMLGAFAAAALIYAIYGGAISLFEQELGLERGSAGSEASAMLFGEYYPNPGGKPVSETIRQSITAVHAFLAEFVGTALLALAIFSITDKSNNNVPARFAPWTIGMTLTVLISLLAPISMGGFNPARDFAPRLFSSLAGWESLPFSFNGMGWLTVYILAPIAGALLGGLFYTLLLKDGYKK